MVYKKPKTLLVEYTPRGKKSRTREIREYLTNLILPYTEMEVLDLCLTPPDLLDPARVRAYYKRNYQNQELTSKENKLLSKIDAMRDQLLRADILILSSPIYNFGFPATTKAWIDSVMQKDWVYKISQDGYEPLLQNLKVCIIYTSGIVYDQVSENTSWNGLQAESEYLFRYMGVKSIKTVHLQGLDMLRPKNIKFRKERVAYRKLNSIAKKWYGYPYPLEVYEDLN